MPDFAHMTLTDLIDPKGYNCDCGKHHAADCKYLVIERGAVNRLPEALKAAGVKKPFIVCDKNTYAAAGKRVEGRVVEPLVFRIVVHLVREVDHHHLRGRGKRPDVHHGAQSCHRPGECRRHVRLPRDDMVLS